MYNKYLPIDPEYFELLDKELQSGNIRVFYFAPDNYPSLKESSGKAIEVKREHDNAYYLLFENEDKVRIDRIVVFNGIPGPAFDEYDAFALAPLTCKAGYDEEC